MSAAHSLQQHRLVPYLWEGESTASSLVVFIGALKLKVLPPNPPQHSSQLLLQLQFPAKKKRKKQQVVKWRRTAAQRREKIQPHILLPLNCGSTVWNLNWNKNNKKSRWSTESRFYCVAFKITWILSDKSPSTKSKLLHFLLYFTICPFGISWDSSQIYSHAASCSVSPCVATVCTRISVILDLNLAFWDLMEVHFYFFHTLELSDADDD